MSTSEPNPYFTGNGTYKPVNPLISNVGDFTPFYVTIAICCLILGSLIILNVICCCSRFADYWLDRHTGNRFLVSIWSATPHRQPPLDLTELKVKNLLSKYYIHQYNDILQYESELPPSLSKQPLTSSQEYLELHKRESDI